MNLHKIILSAMAAIALTACNDEIPVSDKTFNGPITDREVISLPLLLDIVPEEGDITASRAVEDSETGINAKIHDVWILQFEWVEEGTAATDNDAMKDAAELAYWHYIPDYDATKVAKSTATLVVSSLPCFVVVLANTGDPDLGQRMGYELKYSDLKVWRDVIAKQSDLFTTVGTEDSATSFPDNFSGHIIRFNGIKAYKSGISSTTSNITMLLRRNIARIDVDCVIDPSLKASGTDFAIDRMELCNVPVNSYFLTNGNYTADFTAGLPELTREDGTPERFPVDATCHHVKFDNPILTPAASLPTGIDYQARFYAPVNQRGKHINSEQYANEKFKALSAPANATYLRVMAHYTKDGELCPVEYTYYLGADLGETDSHDPAYKHDFNIIGNHTYRYTLNFDALPDPEHDLRVEEYGSVTFPQDEFANCYILNPGNRSGYCRRFNVPVGRVDEFWGNPGLGNEPEKCLADTHEWFAEIVWSDFKVSEFNASRPENEKFGIIKSEGRGKNDYFSVDVPPGMVGNVVVGIKKRIGGSLSDYLWSWHLWITDYNPDREFAITSGTYLYPVPGGNICRMAGEDWETGAYKGAFMMDRFLGAVSRPEPEYPASNNQSCLYYEHGRKDPFLQKYYVGGETLRSDFQKLAQGVNIEDYIKNSIANPTIKYSRGSSVTHTNCALCPTVNSYYQKIVWRDWRVPTETYPGNGLKSIFDPSPLGWIVPDLNAFSDLATDRGTTNVGYTNIDNINNYRQRLPLYTLSNNLREGYFNGVVYWPNSAPWEDKVPENAIYFHATGYFSLNSNTGDFPQNSSMAWTTTFSSQLYFNQFVPVDLSTGNKYNSNELYGCAVRCVRLSKLNK